MATPWSWLLSFSLLPLSVSYAEIATDGSLGAPAQNLAGPNYQINPELGKTQGSNLFHSFSQFNVYQGESADFSAPNSVQNIFARVTGGNVSTIDGTLRSSSQANLWLMNPAGWLIGKNANIDLPASFHLSTASVIDFRDQGQFNTDLQQKSSLSIADPIDYQFNNAKPVTITIDQANITIKEGQKLSLAGGDIHIGESHISAPNGQILIASNKSTGGKWAIENAGLTQSSGDQGEIVVSHASSLNASIGKPSLSISAPSKSSNAVLAQPAVLQLSAKNINLNNAYLSALSRDSDNQTKSQVNLKGEEIQFKRSTINSSVFGNKDGGDIRVEGKNLALLDNSLISTGNSNGSDGASGNINIDLKGRFVAKDSSDLSSTVQGNKSSGTITVNSASVDLDNNSSLRVSTFGKGHAGNIEINSPKVSLSNKSYLESSSVVGASGNAGSIKINSQQVELKEAIIQSLSSKNSFGETGNISIQTGQTEGLQTASVQLRHSLISTTNNKESQGNGGNINVATGTLLMNGGYIKADSLALDGQGGTVTVTAERTLSSQEQLNTSGFVKTAFNQNQIESNTTNTVQAAAPFGRRYGEVNVSRAELNIAGQLAKVDASLLDKRPVADDPCSVERGVSTSSLVEEGNGGLPATAADLASPSLDRYSVTPTANSGSPHSSPHPRAHCQKEKH